TQGSRVRSSSPTLCSRLSQSWNERQRAPVPDECSATIAITSSPSTRGCSMEKPATTTTPLLLSRATAIGYRKPRERRGRQMPAPARRQVSQRAIRGTPYSPQARLRAPARSGLVGGRPSRRLRSPPPQPSRLPRSLTADAALRRPRLDGNVRRCGVETRGPQQPGSVRSGPNVWFIRDRGLHWENADGLGRFWRWASSPCFSFGRPCDLPGLSVRARIGLCRFSRWFSHLSVSTTVLLEVSDGVGEVGRSRDRSGCAP